MTFWLDLHIFKALQYSLVKTQITHCIFTIMNHQRISTFKFCSPVLLGIHKNPNLKEFLKSCESFLRKSQFSKMRYLNPRFGGPWDMLPFWQFFNAGKMALLNPCMEFKNFFGRKAFFEGLWRWHLQKIFLTCPRVQQIQDLGTSF